jgi:hypothetical protein
VDGARAVVGVQTLAFAASDFHGAHGRWPSPEELLADRSLPRLDPWGHEFRFAANGNTFAVRSAGIDGAWGSCDDVHSDDMTPAMRLCPTDDGARDDLAGGLGAESAAAIARPAKRPPAHASRTTRR